MPSRKHARSASNASTRSHKPTVPVLDANLAADSSVALASDGPPTMLLTPPEASARGAVSSLDSLPDPTSHLPNGTRNVVQFLGVAIGCLVAQAVLNGTVMQLPLMRSVAEVSPYLGDSPLTVASLLGWKVLEIAVGWFGGLRDVDMALFTILTNFPQTYFLWTFYAVPFLPLGINLLYNAFANFFGFYLSRSAFSTITRSPGSRPDLVIFLTTRLLAALIYTIPMLFSLNTWLPLHLATHFDGLRTLAPAHSATFQGLGFTFLALGDCAVRLLLNPILHHDPVLLQEESSTASAKEILHFDPATASFNEHLIFNINNLAFWRHLRPVGRLLVKRTAILAGWTVANAAWNACATVEGCKMQAGAWAAGPLGWASVWGAGAVATGTILGWVGGVL